MKRLPVAHDIVALLTRLGVGVIFVLHGWQKLHTWGIGGTSASFEKMGVPAAHASALYATFVELLGGIALIIGAALPIFGVLLFLDMVGAYVFVHASHGLISPMGGELVWALGLASLLVGVAGGKFSVDHLLTRRGRLGSDGDVDTGERSGDRAAAG